MLRVLADSYLYAGVRKLRFFQIDMIPRELV